MSTALAGIGRRATRAIRALPRIQLRGQNLQLLPGDHAVLIGVGPIKEFEKPPIRDFVAGQLPIAFLVERHHPVDEAGMVVSAGRAIGWRFVVLGSSSHDGNQQRKGENGPEQNGSNGVWQHGLIVKRASLRASRRQPNAVVWGTCASSR